MIEELMSTLCGEKPESDIFQISYSYAERDYDYLLKFKEESYNPEEILKKVKKERKRLQNLKRLKNIVGVSDRIFGTDFEEKLVFREFFQVEDRLYRFVLMRDQGVNGSLMGERDERTKWAEKLFLYDKDEHMRFFDSPDKFTRMAMDISGTEDEEPFLWLHSYICEFIDICPKSYLETGSFGKFMRSLFGVLFFSVTVDNINYSDISHLSGYFASTYLFDDILDDSVYLQEEKDQYFRNVLAILNSEKMDKLTLSTDPVMAFSEKAVLGMQEILDEKSCRMVSQAYLAIAQATYIGSNWTYQTPLSDRTLYAIATIKAAYTRVIPAILAGHNITAEFLSHCMRGGLIYQLTDDLRDITDDLADDTVTPFTYYRYGKITPDIHPSRIFLAAVSRISEENFKNIPDATELWIMRISHSLRVLQLKCGEKNLNEFFSELNFPDDLLSHEFALIGKCSDVIIDIEAEAAKNHSDIAVSMRGGWSKKPVFGH